MKKPLGLKFPAVVAVAAILCGLVVSQVDAQSAPASRPFTLTGSTGSQSFYLDSTIRSCTVEIATGATMGGGTVTVQTAGAVVAQGVTGYPDPGNTSSGPTQTLTNAGTALTVPIASKAALIVSLSGATGAAISGYVTCSSASVVSAIVSVAATASPYPNETPGKNALCVSVGANGNCSHPVGCPYHAPISIGASAAGDPFPAVGANQSVYVCAYSAQPFATSSPTAQWYYSTSGTTCTGTTAADGPQVVPSAPAGNVITNYAAQTVQAISTQPIVQSSPGTTLCMHNGGTSPQGILGWVNYNLFLIFLPVLLRLFKL